MARACAPLLRAALLLLAAVPVAFAHGHEEADTHGMMDMHAGQEMHRPMVMADMESFSNATSYWSYAEHSGTAFAHIGIMVVAWVVILPLAVMLSIGRSRLTLPAQLLFHLVNGLGVFVGIIYNHQTPDLYEGNAHHTAGWIISAIAAAWTFLGVVNLFTAKARDEQPWRFSSQPITHRAMEEYQRLDNGRSFDNYRWSSDSGQGTERNTDSLGPSRTSSLNSETGHFPTQKTYKQPEDEEIYDEKQSFLGSSRVERFFSRYVPQISSRRTIGLLTVIYTLLERFMPLLAFFLLASGLVVYGGIFRENHIFNGMAHFVKGGIFFWYGLLTFGRWMGCFADLGWAWNLKPSAEIVGRTRARLPSAEFVESFVIFLYGASNVFLEHLSAWGQAWTAMDLEHVSITIMFFGGGLLGMLIESKAIRKLLKSAMLPSSEDDKAVPVEWQAPKAYVHSLNPMPALVIMLLGIMMSSHTQHSLVSGQIHKQWGTLFCGFALARGVTYLLFWIKPPTSYMPARPPSEVIASFCLVSGGAIFMASNKDTVHALEEYNLDAMFIFTVMMGLTALLMAWTVIVVAIKGWAAQRNLRSPSAQSTPA